MPENNHHHNDDNNDNTMSPWDIAASSPAPVTTRLTLNHRNNDHNHEPSSRISSHYFCCSRRNIQKTLQLWICFDVCLTFGLLSCVWLEPRRHRSFDWVAGIAAALLALRSVWSCCGFSTDWVCERSTLLWSAYISWILIVVAAGGAILILCWTTIAHVPPPSPYGNNSTQRIALQVWLWIIAVMELIRFFLLRHYYRFQVQRDRDDLRRSLFDHEASLRQRPWWWESHENISSHNHHNYNNNDDNMRQPFLQDGLEWTTETRRQLQQQTQTSRESWWDSVFFWRAVGEDAQQDHLRDEGSVDFVSVQDEWASRSEQDPYWWSRDNGDGGNEGQESQGKKSHIFPTWIQTTSSASSSSDRPKLQRSNSHSSTDD